MASWLESLRRDIHFAARGLIRRPGFTAVAVLTLAVGLGTMTVAFSAVNAFFLGGLPVTRSGAGPIVLNDSSPEVSGASFREFDAFRQDVSALDIAGQTIVTLAHDRGDATATVWGLAVSDNYFRVLGVAAAAGRLFAATDDLVAVVSDRFWREQTAGLTPVGTTLRLNGQDVAIVGVLPADFQPGFYDAQVFVRFHDWDLLRLPERLRRPDAFTLNLFGRLRDDATAQNANHQLRLVAEELSRQWPATYSRRAASFVSGPENLPEMRAALGLASVALAMVFVVLLIAVFNVVGLLLARAVDREREMSLRGALGASRARLAQTAIVESLLLAAGGGATALLVARWSNMLLANLAPESPMPQRIDVTPDVNVVLFTAVLMAVSGVLAGIWPARRATRSDLASVIGPSTSTTGRKAGRLRTAVVGVQIAGATLLLACAALLVRNAVLTAQVDLGFERDHALILEIDPASHGYGPAAAERLIDDLRGRLLPLPGVASVTATSRVPFYVGFPDRLEVEPSGRTCAQGACPSVGTYRVGPDYFATMGISVRGTATADRAADTTAVVVSASAARQFWPDTDPIGQTLRIGKDRQRLLVSGVAADIVHRVVGERPEPYIYLPFDELAFAQPVAVVIRTAVDPAALATSVAAQVRELDRGLPIYRLRTMRERLEARQHGGVPIVVRFFGACGILALFLSVIGLSGAVAYAVGQRAREFGIRSALGSAPAHLAWLVVAGALRMTMPGVVTGLGAALLLSQLAPRVIRGVDVDSPLTLIAVALAQVVIASVAAMLPARRAARSDPLLVLRAD